MALFPHLQNHARLAPPAARLRRLRSCRFLLICSSFLAFFAFLAVFSKHIMGDAPAALGSKQYYFEYEVQSGYFVQDEPSKVSKDFDYAKSSLGLIKRDYTTDHEFAPSVSYKATQWQRFENYIETLNKKAEAGEQYKLLILGRHGEGEHNVAEAKYGTEAWDCYWSKLEGDGTLHWNDAHLTKVGEQQALVAHEFWKKALKEDKIPAPQSYYASPLDRCCNTAKLTFNGLNLPKDRPFKPLIKEKMREVLGVHTCDRRSNKAVIAQRYPDFPFEAGFAEEDPLWLANVRESDSELDHRINGFLDDIFEQDKNAFISLTSHSGAIGGFLRVLGHEPFSLPTGGVIPVFVKGQKIYGQAPHRKIEPGLPPPVCDNPPPALIRD